MRRLVFGNFGRNNCIFGIFYLMLTFYCSKTFGNIDVELDVAFRDSVQCRYLYVLSPNVEGTNDTLVVFDTLSFNGQNRVSLFYPINSGRKNMLSIVDSDGLHIESNIFRISPQRTTFIVHVGQQQIKVNGGDYLYLLKNEDERSYYIFLLIFFVVKIIIVAIFVFSSKQRKRLISIASGAFLLSAFAEWFLPIYYLYRFLIVVFIEYFLISIIGRKSISLLRAAVLVSMVNIIGFGIIALLYLGFVFW